MKRVILLSMVCMMTVFSFGRNHVSENATVVADTIFYNGNMLNVANRADASYYRLLMKTAHGMKTQDVFQDFYLDGTLKAEGGYSFIDLNNDANTVLDGEITTYYANGKEKWHGNYVNGKRDGYFTMQMHDGSIAVVEFVKGESKHKYYTVTSPDGNMQKLPISELKSLL